MGEGEDVITGGNIELCSGLASLSLFYSLILRSRRLNKKSPVQHEAGPVIVGRGWPGLTSRLAWRGNNRYTSHLTLRVRGQLASQPASQSRPRLRIKFCADLAVEHKLTFNRAIDIRCMTSGAGPGPLAGLCL